MNASELAQKMLEWESLTRKANEMGNEIKSAVMGLEKTQTVGNVNARYSGGRKSYNRALACANVSDDVIEQHTEIIMSRKVDWNSICKAEKIEDIPFTKSDPSVTLKLTE